MSDRRIEERLDAMLAPLREPARQLDELSQARVRTRLEAAIADDVSPADTSGGRGRRIAGVAVAVALGAAAVVAIVAMTAAPRSAELAQAHRASGSVVATGEMTADRGSGGRAGASVAGGAGATGGPAATRSAASEHAIVLAADSPASVSVAAGQSAQVMVGGAAVTVFGPGRLSPAPDGAVAEGTGVVVDRTDGDGAWSVRYRGATVVAMHATFALDFVAGPRVMVVRGEVALQCSSGSRTVRAGGWGSCPPEEVRATPALRAVAPPPPPPSRPSRSPGSTRPPSAPRSPALPELRGEAAGSMSDTARVDRYAEAETALRLGDAEGARRALLAVIDAAPDSIDAATALLDLARLAARRADTASALAYLERLARHPHRAVLAAAAAHLRATLATGPAAPSPRAP